MDRSGSPHAAPLHVLQVVGNGIVGGVETHVQRLAERLPRAGIRLSALCPFEGPFADGLRALGCSVEIAPMPEEAPWSSIQTACAMVRAGAVDVLHAHMPNAHLLAALAGKLCGKPVLTTIHARQLSPLDIELHHTASTHVSVVCRHSYFHALGMGVAPERLACLPNGVDVERFQPRPRGSGGLRQRLGLAPDAPLVAFIGRLSSEKGPEQFAQAALMLRALQPAAHCVMLGEGPSRGWLEGFIRAHGLGAHLHLPGVQADVAALHADIEVVLSTSHTEAAPLALMEAMASGLAVVASRVGGVPEMIAPGHTGHLVAPSCPSDAAHQVAELLANPAERERLGRNARAHASKHFDMATCARDTAALLRRLAAAPMDAVDPLDGALDAGAEVVVPMVATGLHDTAPARSRSRSDAA